MNISVIIINYNTSAMTERVIRQFLAMEKNLNAEIILIDNGSFDRVSDETANELGVKYIKNDKNIGFAPAVNQGIRSGRGKYVLLLNSDMLIEEGAISRMLEYMEMWKSTGIIGPQFLYPQGNFQPSFGLFPNWRRELMRFTYWYNIWPGATIAKHTWLKKLDLVNPQKVDWLSGGCLLIRRTVLEELGEFDERYFLGVEDIDYCYRAKRLGWSVVYYPGSRVVHFHGLSSGGLRNVLRFTHDRNGFDYFFRKHFPEKRLGRIFVHSLYDAKILFLQIENWLRRRFVRPYRPQDATIAVTYRCNSRCRMCNIWQETEKRDLPLYSLNNLSRDIKYVNLTGGEPFLRDDLPEIVRMVKQASPRAQIIISSNGLATERIIKAMAEIITIDPEVGVRISIDSLGERHDRIRGIPGIYERALTTIERLRVLGLDNLGLSFTIMDENADELRTVYALAESLDLQLALALVQNSEIYFKKNDNGLTTQGKVAEALDYVITNELRSFKPKKWLRAFYDFGLKYYTLHRERILPSGAGYDSLFVDPSGRIFPSNLIALPMGSLAEGKLDQTWSGAEAARVRDMIVRHNIKESWIICTVRGEMKKHLLRVLFWIVKNKTMVHCQDLVNWLNGIRLKRYAEEHVYSAD